MKKLTVKFCAIFALETLAFVVAIVFVAWLALLWRLSQGPLNVDFLTEPLEKTLSAVHADMGMGIDLGTTEMVWKGSYRDPLELHLKDVHVFRTDKTPVLAVSRIGLEVSVESLLTGRVLPKSVTFYGLALRVVRGEDGRISFNIVRGDEAAEAAAPDSTPSEDMVGRFLMMLDVSSNDTGSALGVLKRISIAESDVFYEDRKLGGNWRLSGVNVALVRGRNGLTGSAGIDVQMGEKKATVQVNLFRDSETHNSHIIALFDGLNPAMLVGNVPGFEKVAHVDLSVSGSLEVKLDRDLVPSDGRIFLRARPGMAKLAPLYPDPVPVERIEVNARFDGANKSFSADKIEIDLGAGVLARGTADVRLAGEGGVKVEAKADLKKLPVDKIRTYWPPGLTPVPRDWVTGHLSGGVATLATIDIALNVASDGKVGLERLGGKIEFNGVKVDYFPPLEPVLDVAGTATYSAEKFVLDLEGGKLSDMTVRHSDITISGFKGQENSEIDISVKLDGPFKTALTVLDSPPLKYPTDLGLDPKKIGGRSDVDVRFQFPLHRALALPEVKVSAKARLDDVLMEDIVAGYNLTGGPFDLGVDNQNMNVRGKGLLGAMPVDVVWRKNFATSAEFSSRLDVGLNAESALLEGFGVPTQKLGLKGRTPLQVAYTTMFDGSGSAFVTGDISQAAIDIAPLGYSKVPGTPGSVSLTAHLRQGKTDRISGLRIIADGLSAGAEVWFTPSGAVDKADISDLKIGSGTHVSAEIRNKGADGYAATVKGAQFDASSFFKERKEQPPRVFPTSAGSPFALSMDVGRLITGKGRALDKARVFLRRDGWERTDQLEMDALAGGKIIYLRYMPVPSGHSLRFEAADAGATLRALGLSNGVQGGTLVIDGRPNPKGGRRDLAGQVSLTNFRLIKVPALAKLLNALSLPGFQELLENKGIAFTKMKARFNWIDKTPPDTTAKPVQVLRLSDGQTAGASLGLTFEGTLDDIAGNLDLSGTIIPVSDLNKLISNIPVVGDILAGGTGAVFAATYTVTGPTADPTVTVNPLAALAPGLLRKLFFEK